jgi:hypothetical protein
MRADSILALGKCSKIIINYSVKGVAALFFAATLLMCPAFAFECKVNVEGPPPWLSEIAERSLNAVVEKLPSGQPENVTQKIIKVVSEKIFAGYKIESVNVSSNVINVLLKPDKTLPQWKVEIQPPNIQNPPLEWFKSDIARIEPILLELMNGLPVESLSWCDTGLRDEIMEILKPVLPGWKPSLIVHTKNENMLVIVSFTPELPLVLAVYPRLSSNSLPTLLNSELKEDLMEKSAPFIGLPVAWTEVHAADINKWTESFLKEESIIEKTAADSLVSFSAGQVSQMNVRVESRHYTIGAWAAVYGGIKDKSAELGIHLGRRINLFSDRDIELYGEGIIELQDWNPEGRLGARISPWGDVWIGGEWSSADNMWWGRLNIDPRLHKPYSWLRVREDGEINAALGWKATEYISFEVYYDSREENAWGLRLLGNM